MEKLLNYEHELFLYLNNLGSEKYDKFWLYLSNEWYWVPVYLLLVLIVYHKLGAKKFIVFVLVLGLFLFVSDEMSMWFKETTQRWRPCRNELLDGKFRLVIEGCRGNYSFYSAHASNHALLATVLFALFKNYKISRYLLIIWALLIAYSRIYLGVHFPMDVVMGVAVGFLLGTIFNYLMKKIGIYSY